MNHLEGWKLLVARGHFGASSSSEGCRIFAVDSHCKGFLQICDDVYSCGGFCTVGDRVYLAGGMQTDPTRPTALDLVSAVVKELRASLHGVQVRYVAKMVVPMVTPVLVPIRGEHIYNLAVGTQRYSVEANFWVNLKQQKRFTEVVWVVDQRYIYSSGTKGEIRTERLDVLDEEAGWDEVSPPVLTSKTIVGTRGTQISPNEILLVLGGAISNELRILDTRTNRMRETGIFLSKQVELTEEMENGNVLGFAWDLVVSLRRDSFELFPLEQFSPSYP